MELGNTKSFSIFIGFLVREQDVNYWRYFDRIEQSFVNPSSLLKDDEVIAEASLVKSSEEIEYSFNPEQPIKLEKDANNSWGLRLYLPKSERYLKVQPYGLDCEKGSIKFQESKRIFGKNLATDECLIKVEEAYFTSSIRRSL